MKKSTSYAGFSVRLLASIADSLIIYIPIYIALSAIYGVEQYWNSEDIIVGYWDFALSWIFPALWSLVFWSYKQATPGKIIAKLKIVDEKSGQKPSMKQWIIRYVGYFISTIPLFLGFLWVIWDKKKQGFHDKLAGTVVIKKSITPRFEE